MREHAIVIGGSIGGLITAAALASRYERVTVVERHAAPTTATSVAPHGRYTHVLLEGGQVCFDAILPGFTGELLAAKAPAADRDSALWWADGWRARRALHNGARVLASRGLVESTARARVEALPNVSFTYDTTIDGLVHRRDGTVIGVRTPAGELIADLVVDCSGRASRASQWLANLGYAAAPVTEIDVDLCYVSLSLRRKPTDLGGKLAIVVQNIAPHITRMGLAVAVEGDRWTVLLGGYFGDMPPTDRAGYLAFARSLPVPELAQLLEGCEPIDEPLPYRFKSSRRVHFERVTMPTGFVVLGDAMCSFNPLYAQGMTVVGQQAKALGEAIDHDRLDTVHERVAAIADQAWMIAAGGDLAYPQVVGERSRMSGVVRGYMAKVFRACSVDGHVVSALWNVTNLLAPPSSLFKPAIMLRVLRGNRRVQRERATSYPTTRSATHPVSA